MAIIELNVNPLPAKTWHWVKMNDSELRIELPEEAPHIEIRGIGSGLNWKEKDPSQSVCDPERLEDGINWDSIETGMGDEFAGIMSGSRCFHLNIPENFRSDENVVICADSSDSGAACQILVHAGRKSAISLVVAIRNEEENGGAGSVASDTDVSDSNDTVAVQMKFYAEEGAEIKLYVVQEMQLKGMNCLNIGGVCEDRAQVELTGLFLGSLKEYAGIAVELQGEESSFSADIGYRVRSSQKLDINYVARHTGKKSYSGMNAWGVLEEDAFKLFRGTIDFAEGCSGSKGQEKEDVLLLGEHQVNQTIPLILCHEEDVEGDHGATISRLDDQVLFYLGSRGIDPQTAEDIIARARIEALLNRIPDMEICSQAESMTGSFENENIR